MWTDSGSGCGLKLTCKIFNRTRLIGLLVQDGRAKIAPHPKEPAMSLPPVHEPEPGLLDVYLDVFAVLVMVGVIGLLTGVV